MFLMPTERSLLVVNALQERITLKTETVVQLLGEILFHTLNDENPLMEETVKAVYEDAGIDWLGHDHPADPLLLAINLRAFEWRVEENKEIGYQSKRDEAVVRLMRERNTTAVWNEIEELFGAVTA
jgi:hypothetical protein